MADSLDSWIFAGPAAAAELLVGMSTASGAVAELTENSPAAEAAAVFVEHLGNVMVTVAEMDADQIEVAGSASEAEVRFSTQDCPREEGVSCHWCSDPAERPHSSQRICNSEQESPME